MTTDDDAMMEVAAQMLRQLQGHQDAEGLTLADVREMLELSLKRVRAGVSYLVGRSANDEAYVDAVE